MRVVSALVLLVLGITAGAPIGVPLAAKVIGMNMPAPPVNLERISELPAEEQAAWRAYISRSEARMRADKAALAAELSPGATLPPSPWPDGASLSATLRKCDNRKEA